MLSHPFLAPDDVQEGTDKRFTESEMQQLLSEKITAETQRYEAALQKEAALRQQAETALNEHKKALYAHEMRIKAQSALRERNLPEQLLGAINFSTDETLSQTLTAAEEAFRAALEEGVRSRLRSQAPSLIPLPQKSQKPRNRSYQEAAADYMRGLNHN